MGKRKGRSEREGGQNGRRGEGREEQRKKGRGEAWGKGEIDRKRSEEENPTALCWEGLQGPGWRVCGWEHSLSKEIG